MVSESLSYRPHGSKIDRVITPSVFITNDYALLKKYFLNQKTFKGISDPKDYKTSFLITPENNKYLTSLEHSNNFDQSKHQKLTLQFLDVDGRLEEDFFLFKLNSFKSLLETVYRQEEELKKNLLDPTLYGSRDMESRLKATADKLSIPHQIYVSYGVGSELSNWSNPMIFHLISMTMDISNGLRRYTLQFYPSNSSVFRSRIQFNFQSPNPEREFLFTDNIAPFVASHPVNQKTDTIDSVIYNLLKNYVSILTTTKKTNVICILPPVTPQTKLMTDDLRKYFSISTEMFLDTVGLASQDDASFPGGMAPDNNLARGAADSMTSLTKTSNYILRAQKLLSSVNPGFPDFYEPLNKISNGYKSILKSVDELILVEENDTRLLNIFARNGLITDPDSRCILIGLESLINEWVYRNMLPGLSDLAETESRSLETILKDFKPKTTLIHCPEKERLINQNYISDFINLYQFQKSRSSLNEELNIDELAFGQFQKYSESIKNNKKLFDFLGIPIFTNNLRNSNVLNLNLNNSELYLNGVKLAIDSDAAMFYLTNITRNMDSLNIKGLPTKSILEKLNEVILLSEKRAKNQPGEFSVFSKNIDGYGTSGFITNNFNINNGEGYTFNALPTAVKSSIKQAVLFDSRATMQELIRQRLFLAKSLKLDINKIEDLVSDDLSQYEQNTKGAFTPQGPGGSFYDLPARFLLKSYVSEYGIKGSFNFIPKDQAKKIISDNIKILKDFELLIVKSGGDFNADLLTFASVIRDFELNKSTTIEQVMDLEKSNATLEGQQRLLDYALILTKLFTIKGFNESSKDEFKDGVMFKPKQFGLNQDNIAAELYKYIATNSYNVTLKTLPFFHLSTLRSVNFKPCFLFSRKMNIINPSKSIANELDFFSGMYNIYGFKHVINTKECYSQFVLIKNIGNALAT